MRPALWAIRMAAAVLLLWIWPGQLQGAPTLTSWEPKFKGVDLCVGSNLTASAEFPNRSVAYALRIDLTDPDIQLFTTPRHSNYVANSREVAAYTVSDFLRTYKLQAAINANFFSVRNYYLPPAYPMDLYGFAVSTGQVVSAQQNRDESTSLIFDASNVPELIATNWPPVSSNGVYTAVTGNYPLLINGTNVARRTDVEPRTAFGISRDKRFLYLLAVDGRQAPYSAGAYDSETANWLLLLGAHDAVNMDGGGSTTLILESSTGGALRINKPSAVADGGRERTVGGHLGIYAKPLPDFIYDPLVTSDGGSAIVSWKTLRPSLAEIRYGLTEELGESVAGTLAPTNFHSARLTGLLPATGYYYRIAAVVDGEERLSPLFLFTMPGSSTELMALTNAWKHTSSPQPAGTWAMLEFNDSAWHGPDPALLWIDAGPAGPNPEVQPKGTELPSDSANNGLPYITYYFRASIQLADLNPQSSLLFRGQIDDGAVFYLNGSEIYRVRMPAESGPAILATSFPCEGDATCFDEFRLFLPDLPSARIGQNLLAVEVHNYHPFSDDITFGLTVERIDPAARPRIGIRAEPSSLVLTWSGAGLTLQSAPGPAGPWEDVAGVQGSSAAIEPSGSARFFRLRQ